MNKGKVIALSAMLILLGMGAIVSRANWLGTNLVTFNLEHPPLLGLAVKRVAFGPANGQCSDQLTDQVMQDFLNNHIEVIDRNHLSQIMAEYKLNMSGYVDPESGVALGKLLGPSALVYVKVDECEPQQQPLYKDQHNYYNGSTTRHFLSKTQVFLNGSIQTVDLTTGKMLSAQTFQSNPTRQNDSTSGQPEFPPEPEVMNEAITGAADQIHRMFFPWVQPVSLLFHDDGECHLKKAYMLASGGDFQGALAQSQANVQTCQSGRHKPEIVVRAYYNLGLCYLLVGEYEKAMPMLDKALELKGSARTSQVIGVCRKAEQFASELGDYKKQVAAEGTLPPLPAVNPSAPPSPSATPATSAATPSASVPPAQTASPAPALTIEQRLKELNELYKQGLITKQQYDAKRAEILKAL